MSRLVDPLRTSILDFLYQQVQENKIPQIKKGMVEDLEAFVLNLINTQKAQVFYERMSSQSMNNPVQQDNSTTEE